jgi:ppGpp synthetase/RelA/SpoT-type nucleotidyltranferase
MWSYRVSFARPLRLVTVGVRQFVKREAAEVVVSQRLKRLPTIVDKLSRHPNMKLTRMQDIGGCRAILASRGEVDGVLTRITRNWNVRKIFDYVEEPKPVTGYRAVHVVVEREDRLIEIQLRTPNQHQWAIEIERAGSRLALPRLKDGEGPEELVRYFELAALFLALEDAGESPDEEFMREFRDLRTAVRPYFRSRSGAVTIQEGEDDN